MIFWAVYDEVWYQRHEFPDIVTSSWAFINATRAQVSMKAKLNQSLCTDGMYGYQYDPAGQWVFKDSKCKPLCEHLVADVTCFLLSDLTAQKPSGVFFVTAMAEEYIQKTAAAEHARVHGRDSYIVPLEAEYAMQFTYAYAVSESKAGKKNPVAQETLGHFCPYTNCSA